MGTWPVVRNVVLFIAGAVILILELEWHEHTRGWVIALALFMMGVVTADQVRHFVVGKMGEPDDQKSWPRMPVEGLQHPQEPDPAQEPTTGAVRPPERPTPPRRPEGPPEPPGLL